MEINNYRPRTYSFREGHVLSHVCLSVFSYRDPHVIGYMRPSILAPFP